MFRIIPKNPENSAINTVELFINEKFSGFCTYKIQNKILKFLELSYPSDDAPLGDALLRAVLNIGLNNRVKTADFGDINDTPPAAVYGYSGEFDIAEFFENKNCRSCSN